MGRIFQRYGKFIFGFSMLWKKVFHGVEKFGDGGWPQEKRFNLGLQRGLCGDIKGRQDGGADARLNPKEIRS